MQGNRDNETLEISTKSYDVALLTDIGDREEQQDNYGWFIGDESALVVACDGMGGYKGGRAASRLAVQTVLEAYEQQADGGDPVSFLQAATKKADQLVSAYTFADGTPFEGGTTLVSILLYKTYLFWNSVGDSRVYVFRENGEYVQLTQDQNYRTVIDERLRTGKISREEYQKQAKKANALINYVGIGDLELIDYNSAPLALQKNDRILITTDGLFRLLNDGEIASEVLKNRALEDTLSALYFKVLRNARKNSRTRDNLTMVLIQVR